MSETMWPELQERPLLQERNRYHRPTWIYTPNPITSASFLQGLYGRGLRGRPRHPGTKPSPSNAHRTQ